MPKTKEFVSSSESGSESADEPKPKKKKVPSKPETEKKEAKKSSGTKGPNGEKMFELGRMRYATVSEFKGKCLVSIREYYEADNGIRPGKKGISLSIDQWNALKDVIDDVDQAVKDL